MPIYEYRCQECGHELEKLQRMSDDRLVDCPACKAPQLKRLISAAGFRLKGGGWYETDFKQGQKRNLVESTDGAAKASSDSEKKDGGSKSAAAAKADKGSAGKSKDAGSSGSAPASAGSD
jgi:putative FmdB family regulatory protein